MSKAEGIAILLTAVLISLALGFYFGRNSVRGTMVVSTELPLQEVASDILEASAPPEAISAPVKEAEEVEWPIDLNTATTEELQMLPKIGPVLAERIVAYRESMGGFVYKEELMNVEGIGQTIYDKLEEYVEVRNTP